MPMIFIRYLQPDHVADLRQPLAVAVADLARSALGKDPAVTAVLVEPAAREHWFIGGARPGEAGRSAAWVDIKVTAGTNTKKETTAFVQQTYQSLERILGPLHPVSYVMVHTVEGSAYGYGGRTQDERWLAP